MNSSLLAGPENYKGVFKESTVPLLVFEVYMADDMAMANPVEIDSATDSVISRGIGHYDLHDCNVTIPAEMGTHPLSAGITGTFSLTPGIVSQIKWINPNDAAIKVAHIDTAENQWVLCAYDVGAQLVDGTAATGKRIAFGLGDYMPARLGYEGKELFDAMLRWCFDESPKWENFITLDLTAPTDMDTIVGGQTLAITWASGGTIALDSVVLDYSNDGGATWLPIAVAPNTGEYTWTIPDAAADSAIVRIQDPQGRIADMSKQIIIEPAPEEGGCGSCGSGSGLAFIPLIGIGIHNFYSRKKKKMK
jgi:hypothetical protein